MLKYQQIANEIEQYINEQQLKQGDKLPVLEQMMNQYAVSKSTITKALELLERKGVIFQLRGSGIFVRRHNRPGYMSLFSTQGFKSNLGDRVLTSDVIDVSVMKPDALVAENLGIGVSDDVYRVERVRYVDGEVLCHEESYYVKAIVPYLNREIVADSIFDYVQSALGVTIGFSDMYLQVDRLTEGEAGHLGLQENDPTLRIETIFHLTNGKPFDYSRITYHYAHSQFVIQANGPYM
ncbi:MULTISPECIES: GntR family transcriptional regulator [Exiguobacterium]|uniref:Transcriptional regulator, GntR family n=1 Tax=Exiguobacterium sp. (strain ATCC BAA-1283 / AT1b) TaxID=360911 RepID=C4L211_EXISA|nr:MULTISPECIES: GntR family transcriptional regulator [unclassified Exiguobacterium]ACQ69185.1 transcriptional regulator, GntR family [Exiguobacterium sp. AT1b]